MRSTTSLRLALSALALAGCYSTHEISGELPDAGPRDAAPVDAAPIRPDARPRDAGIDAEVPGALRFRPCDGAGTLGGSADVRCATLRAPLDRDDPDGRQLDLFVESVRPRGARVRTQLWMLQGGPGGASAVTFEGVAEFLHSLVPDLEVLMIDHRGTGLSERPTCAAESPGSAGGTLITDDEWASCVDELRTTWGDSLTGFSVTEAAEDLSVAIEGARVPGARVFVYGVSYGTYWAHRWMQLHPAQSDGVILDSICSPGECTFPLAFTRNHETVGAELLARCAEDPTCRANVGADPVGVMRAALTSLETGGCPAAVASGLDADAVRLLASGLLRDPVLRGAIPALAHRVRRCAPQDRTAFVTAAGLVAEGFGDEQSLMFFSQILFAEIARSELWDTPPTEAEYRAAMRTGLFATPLDPDDLAAWQRLPFYTDPLAPQYAETSVPVLMWNGQMDPQTSLEDARPLGMHLSGPNQTYVEFANATHGILFWDGRDIFGSCGMRQFVSFLQSPTTPVDISCRNSFPPPRFDDDSLAGGIFGTDSLYGLALRPPGLALSAEIAARDEAVRERVIRVLRAPPL